MTDRESATDWPARSETIPNDCRVGAKTRGRPNRRETDAS